jgi:hypothetical protein
MNFTGQQRNITPVTRINQGGIQNSPEFLVFMRMNQRSGIYKTAIPFAS